MTSIDFHTGNLDKLCHVCGNKMKRGRKVFTVANHIINLQKAFWIDNIIANDSVQKNFAILVIIQ